MINRVKGYRNMMGLTQKMLANKLNISPQALSAKENGRRNFNDTEKMYLLNFFKEIDSDLTMEKLFFAEKTDKSYFLEDFIY